MTDYVYSTNVKVWPMDDGLDSQIETYHMLFCLGDMAGKSPLTISDVSLLQGLFRGCAITDLHKRHTSNRIKTTSEEEERQKYIDADILSTKGLRSISIKTIDDIIQKVRIMGVLGSAISPSQRHGPLKNQFSTNPSLTSQDIGVIPTGRASIPDLFRSKYQINVGQKLYIIFKGVSMFQSGLDNNPFGGTPSPTDINMDVIFYTDHNNLPPTRTYDMELLTDEKRIHEQPPLNSLAYKRFNELGNPVIEYGIAYELATVMHPVPASKNPMKFDDPMCKLPKWELRTIKEATPIQCFISIVLV